MEKSEIKQESEKSFPLNNIGYINSGYANKLAAHKNFEIEKFDDKLNSVIKILNNSNEEDFAKNSIMPYENVNYLQKVVIRKKSNSAIIERSNSNNINNFNYNFVNEDALNLKVK